MTDIRKNDSIPCVSPTTSDEGLLQRIGNGDTLAMHILYARHHVQVYRFTLRQVGNAVVAEDVTSDVFLDVWRHANRFGRRSAVTTWLLAIARFKAFSALRCRRNESWDEDAAGRIEDSSDDPEIALDKKEKSAIIRKCMTRLSREHREITDLVYYHEKSVKEVARIVRIPATTVKMRMFYARKKLAELLEAEGVVGIAA